LFRKEEMLRLGKKRKAGALFAASQIELLRLGRKKETGILFTVSKIEKLRLGKMESGAGNGLKVEQKSPPRVK